MDVFTAIITWTNYINICNVRTNNSDATLDTNALKCVDNPNTELQRGFEVSVE